MNYYLPPPSSLWVIKIYSINPFIPLSINLSFNLSMHQSFYLSLSHYFQWQINLSFYCFLWYHQTWNKFRPFFKVCKVSKMHPPRLAATTLIIWNKTITLKCDPKWGKWAVEYFILKLKKDLIDDIIMLWATVLGLGCIDDLITGGLRNLKNDDQEITSFKHK